MPCFSARLIIVLVLALAVVGLDSVFAQEQQSNQTSENWWSATIDAQLQQAADNRAEILKSLQTIKPEHRPALSFLIEHMPTADLQSLTSEFLLENIRLSYQVKEQMPWGDAIPEHIFFNDVLPYANVDETRENWRLEMMDRCLPIVKQCQTPGEAAQKLNRELFSLINVKYSRKRKRANQSPSESIELSRASCTGLSIILSDACRSVGVPARLVGTPSWTKKQGNHTWVEIWDQGWKFTGAAEPADQLNKGWFKNDASHALDDDPRHRIYAVSYAKTGMYFPMVWAPRNQQVPGVNVTPRYITDRETLPVDQSRVLISIFDAKGNRLVRQVSVVPHLDDDEPTEDSTADQAQPLWTGQTRGPEADTNDILSIQLKRNQQFQITWTEDGTEQLFIRSTADQEQTWWRFQLEE